jgi:hypothetical protein
MTSKPWITPARLRDAYDRQAALTMIGFGITPEIVIGYRFRKFYHPMTPAELLLRPREALRFCDDFRAAAGNHDIPDHVILRALVEGEAT